jgi:DNA-binding MurR/RpiR family transcriptional regulator
LGCAAPEGSPQTSPARTGAAPESLTQRIHRVYDDLPDAERRAADMVLDSPGELAALNAAEIAERSGVSNATVSRFFRRLGYGSYDEARRAARTMRAMGSPLYLAEASGRADGASLSKHLAQEAQVIESTLAMLSPLTLDEVAARLVARLAAAPRVRLAGFRNSYFPADYARQTLSQMRPGVALLTAPGQTLAEGVAGVGPGDMVMVIGLRRRPAGFADFMRVVARTGADVALVADRSVRASPAEARWTIACAVETPRSLDSYGDAMAVLRALALETMRRLGQHGRRHLDKIATLLDALGELE